MIPSGKHDTRRPKAPPERSPAALAALQPGAPTTVELKALGNQLDAAFKANPDATNAERDVRDLLCRAMVKAYKIGMIRPSDTAATPVADSFDMGLPPSWAELNARFTPASVAKDMQEVVSASFFQHQAEPMVQGLANQMVEVIDAFSRQRIQPKGFGALGS